MLLSKMVKRARIMPRREVARSTTPVIRVEFTVGHDERISATKSRDNGLVS